jgi:hypothetical protein
VRKVLKYMLTTIVVIGALIQFYRPARTNLPVNPVHTIQAHTNMPPDVEATLRRACFDCHSNESRWPWYSNVAPASWLLTQHVNGARQQMNFSEWDRESGPRAVRRFDSICDEVTQGGMPLPSYLILHADARLSPEDVKSICAWTQRETQRAAQQSK